MKLLGRVGLGLLIFLVVTAAGTLGWAWFEDRPADESLGRQFHIPAGESLTQTADRLAQQHLIRSSLVFRWFFRLSQGDGTFPSGTFDVPGGLTAREASAFFRHAQPLQIRVTVPEGWTSTKIARLLEDRRIVKAQDFLTVVQHPAMLGPLGAGLDSLEGRLFPDTYQFPLDSAAVDVAKAFVQTFHDKTAAWTPKFSTEEWGRRIILASIVEREYRDPEEAPLIASVFANRLEKGIALGSCATIEYILTEIQGRPHPKRIFFVHTEIPSPFNTYLNKGLPPAPISNPGLTALKAAFQPTETNYLYFVVADAAKGTHTFSSNYSQHERAREAYLATFVTKG